MYSRLLLNFCERFLYRTSNSVRSPNIKTISHVANKSEEKRKEEFTSTRFPDYEVIYVFPFIKQACGINVVKYRFTIFTGVVAPIIVGLHLANFLPFDITTVSLTTGIITTLWLHSVGILCNNLIGYVYLKLDEEKVILSYIDYWGKRIDLKVSCNEIYPMSDNPISITDPLYRKITLTSQKEILKINMKLGQIIDVDKFRCILGMV
ncbi:PREDICTED: transmembrane protein 186-like [Cyphomyrmex costatus]|uniref:Transmembrane protein 186 n=1 Tax=Cyphomyrmex costatus TaxID=456900 RepID=A0A151K2D4_9HYME|nr:PREDICTED: transmembrane protein 186-like [Cyphomyrmex costatus]XP_018404174.1 PREDICTED: transmembrane protein 186-like [Cyphomyrmex costatus]KYM94996.1 hypothetical protein ALC62_14592 [Cyphomyrmex costatus]KYN50280.1 hypothetical protein ALC62_09281 [Cyphomyrmex costatus]